MSITTLNAAYGVKFNNNDAGNVIINTNGQSNLCYNASIANLCANCYGLAFNLQNDVISHKYVTSMQNAYYNCGNITGSPVCGPNVMNMSRAYYNCFNLTGNPVCGPNVNNMREAYFNCTNLTGNVYFNWSYGGSIYVFTNCFYGCPLPINVIVKNRDLFNGIKSTTNKYGIKGNVTWTTVNANCFYNGNLYVYYAPEGIPA